MDDAYLLWAVEKNLPVAQQAMRALGSPVLTQDYDLWFDRKSRDSVLEYFGVELHYDLVHAPIESPPLVTVLAGTERIDAWFVRGMVNREQKRVDFDELFARSAKVGDPEGVWFRVPSIDDMIALERMGVEVRPKDEEDIRYLQVRRELIAQGRLPR